ncbi:hypothetical protein [Ralstonia pseudosolanacearum]|uniref:hypothetical protein n=1 Tax=Ralstonia pseudosolanacearum TaxID=1310165 RepID=UPI003CF576BB
MNTPQQVETVKQEAARLGISISEVRRRRNAATPIKETLRLVDGGTYRDGHGEICKVRLLGMSERFPSGTRHIFICDKTHCRYTEFGIYDAINGPLVNFNLVEEVQVP